MLKANPLTKNNSYYLCIHACELHMSSHLHMHTTFMPSLIPVPQRCILVLHSQDFWRFYLFFCPYCFISPYQGTCVIKLFWLCLSNNRYSSTFFIINTILKSLQVLCGDTLISRKNVLAPFAVTGICTGNKRDELFNLVLNVTKLIFSRIINQSIDLYLYFDNPIFNY